MKLKNRIVPYTTVFLCEDKDFNDIVNQTVNWCSGESFNPAGRAYVVNVETYTISIVNKLREKKIKPRAEFTKASLIYFMLKIKPSILISFSISPIARAILFFSRAGRTLYPKSLFSMVFSDISFRLDDPPVIKKTAPYLFNSEDGDKRFGYRSTKFSGAVYEKKGTGEIDVFDTAEEENIQLDLGNLPKNPDGTILWIPRRTTTKTVWTDFMKLTYFAEKENCRISVQVRSEAEKNAFATVFFIKGRKLDMDNYLHFVMEKKVDDLVVSPQKFGIESLKWVVFSFGLTTEYKRISGTLNNSNGEKVTGLTTIKKMETA
jgi:hypothetical protein